jgi:hypothetical protein
MPASIAVALMPVGDTERRIWRALRCAYSQCGVMATVPRGGKRERATAGRANDCLVWTGAAAGTIIARCRSPPRVQECSIPARPGPGSGHLDLLALRRLRFTGPEIAEVLDLPLSTVSEILSRIGMGQLGRLGLEPAVRYEREQRES